MQDRYASFSRFFFGAIGSFMASPIFFVAKISSFTFYSLFGLIISISALMWGISDKKIGVEKLESFVYHVLLNSGGSLLAYANETEDRKLYFVGILNIFLSFSLSRFSIIKARLLNKKYIDITDLKQ